MALPKTTAELPPLPPVSIDLGVLAAECIAGTAGEEAIAIAIATQPGKPEKPVETTPSKTSIKE